MNIMLLVIPYVEATTSYPREQLQNSRIARVSTAQQLIGYTVKDITKRVRTDAMKG